MKLIPLSNSGNAQFALVDDEDYTYLIQYKWREHNGYVQRSKHFYQNGIRKTKSILMHREILKTPKGLRTDHRDHNGLNNQRYNIRIATVSQNGGNLISKTGNSIYKGVYFDKNKNKYRATIQGRYLGQYKTEIEAALAYNDAAKILFNEFAYLNII